MISELTLTTVAALTQALPINFETSYRVTRLYLFLSIHDFASRVR